LIASVPITTVLAALVVRKQPASATTTLLAPALDLTMPAISDNNRTTPVARQTLSSTPNREGGCDGRDDR